MLIRTRLKKIILKQNERLRKSLIASQLRIQNLKYTNKKYFWAFIWTLALSYVLCTDAIERGEANIIVYVKNKILWLLQWYWTIRELPFKLFFFCKSTVEEFYFNNISDIYYWITFVQLLKIVFLLMVVAYFTIAERKGMAAIQRRKGPNVVGIWGLLQPIADGAKLVFKELLIPTRAEAYIFLAAPIMILILSILNWSVFPTGLTTMTAISKFPNFVEIVEKNQNISAVADISYGILFILAISGFNVYGIIIAGWASNSKYAFLGSLRSAAQMISYEVSLGLLILPVILLAGSLNFTDIVIAQTTGWYFLPLFPCAFMFFISMLAETNRTPFDLPEAEAELVAGYNVEYSSIIFAMFFLGEYTNMLFMSGIIVILFFGGWLPVINVLICGTSLWFISKILIFCFLYILVRSGLPRYRYDHLMNIGWKKFLPLALGYLVCIVGVLFAFDALPYVFEINPPVYKEIDLMFEKFFNV
jgi:NADH-quinone oxidoreductase subunit H